jgi:hypothetical protein
MLDVEMTGRRFRDLGRERSELEIFVAEMPFGVGGLNLGYKWGILHRFDRWEFNVMYG